MVNIFIIDDSMFIRNILVKILKDQEGINILGEAANPVDAMSMFKEVGIPDVFILDIEMPKMDGLTFLEKLKNERPIPTIIFASLPNNKSTKAIEALELGAFDIVVKPKELNKINDNYFINDFVKKIKAAVNMKSINYKKEAKINFISNHNESNKIIAIGASTGGVQTLENILSQLNPSHPPILITQHMPEGFTASFANRLNKICINSNVKEVEESEIIENGDIFIAPGNMHLEIRKTKNNKFQTILKDYQKVSNHKPSVDVLFKSFAKEVKENSIAFILTGMGKDGALGIKMIKDSGGITYGQNEETSIVYGMPKVAFNLGGIDKQVSINEVVDIINNIK